MTKVPAFLGAGLLLMMPVFAEPGMPRVFETEFPTPDLVIATFDVRESGARPGADIDQTAFFQSTIDACHEAGGGVVFAPAGKYRIDGRLDIRSGVVLRGEWRNPENKKDERIGTLLSTTYGKGLGPLDDPFIGLHNSSGIKDLAIWYPEQDFQSPEAYAFTIAQVGKKKATVENVTLVNPFRGIRLGPGANEFFTAVNVFMTPLQVGFRRDQVYDCARMHRIRMKPCYWTESGLPGAPATPEEIQALEKHMLSNSTGAVISHYAWTWMYDWEIEGCNIGVETRRSWVKNTYGGPNGGFVKLELKNCRTGMIIGVLNPQGWSVTDAVITSDVPGSVGIRTIPEFDRICQFNSVTFGGRMAHAIHSESLEGTVSLFNCSFEDWAEHAVRADAGTIQITQCDFKQNKPHVFAGKAVQAIALLGNVFEEKLILDDRAPVGASRAIDHTPLNLETYDPSGFVYPEAYFKPAKTDLFVVKPAKGDRTADLQKALNEAKRKGGGTVYILPGRYRLDGTLLIPSGVELRGVFDVVHHTSDDYRTASGEELGMRGSELFTTHGKGRSNAAPFIRLEAGSSIRGVTIYHPGQTWSHYEKTGSFTPFPWTLQALGRNVRLKDVTLANAWRGADFGSYDTTGHQIDYLCGTALETGLYINRSKHGGVKNVHWIGTYWCHSRYPDRPAARDGAVAWELIRDASFDSLTGYVIGGAKNESMLHTFIFGSKVGQRMVRGKGGGASGTFIMHGTDESRVSVRIDDVDDMQFLNYQLVSMSADSPRSYLTIGNKVQGRARFDNLLMWGYMPGPDTGIKMGSGDITIHQCNFMNHGTEVGIDQTGGNLEMVNARYHFGVNAFVAGDNQGLYGRFLPTIGKTRIVGLIKRNNESDEKIFDNQSGNKMKTTGSMWQR